MRKLSPKERAFVREYLVDLNATQAAIRAGYSARSARNIANRLMTKAHIQEAIEAGTAKKAERAEVKAEDILRELMRIARVDVGDAFDESGHLKPLKDIPEDVRRAISGIDVEEAFEGVGREREQTGWVKKVRFWDKVKALELLGKHLALWTEKLKVSGDVSAPFLVEVVSYDKEEDDGQQRESSGDGPLVEETANRDGGQD